MADHLTSILGDFLYEETIEDSEFELPTPSKLRKKILVKAKRLPKEGEEVDSVEIEEEEGEIADSVDDEDDQTIIVDETGIGYLNVRSEPDAGSELVDTVDVGTELPYTEEYE